jgi:transposase
MKRLRPYRDHGFLELDNNTAERATRSVAVGRKNHLFVGSQTGGHDPPRSCLGVGGNSKAA